MRVLLPIVAFACFYLMFDYSIWSSAAIAIWAGYLVNFFLNINGRIAFREYVLLMYGLNYLFSPAIQYHLSSQQWSTYRMRLPEADYFVVAIPAMLCFHLGLYAIKTKVFTPNFTLDKLHTKVNEGILKQFLIGGFLLSFFGGYLPGEIAFVAYLVSGVRYVGAFGLFIIDKKKYKWYLLIIMFVEISHALRSAMFHDMVIWILFFGMVWTYLNKPSAFTKVILGTVAFFCFYILQTSKATYRDQLKSGESGFGSFSQVVSQNAEGGSLFNVQNVGTTVVRANQGWIYASAMKQMNFKQNYQGMTQVKRYFEAAILPRFLAPNKMEAGDKEIFNTFSGVKIYGNTSMALGILADGYISFGPYGSMIFALALGLMFAVVFKIIEGWSRISPFFILLVYVILNFAVRADCETQTLMGHLVKGVAVFGAMIYFYKQYFAKQLYFGWQQKEQFSMPAEQVAL